MSDRWEKGWPGQKIKLPDPRGVHHVKESPCACWRFGRRFGCCRLMVNCSELLLDEVDRLGVPFQRLDLRDDAPRWDLVDTHQMCRVACRVHLDRTAERFDHRPKVSLGVLVEPRALEGDDHLR